MARLLLVDDDPTILSVVKTILEDDGHAVTAVGSGVEALRELEGGSPPDLVVLDMRMPYVDGWELRRRMDERGIDVPLFVMTAARDAGASADEVRAVGFIAKPFDIDELAQRVELALGDRSRR